jgi:fumarylacetoacetate (FAA) hydrolase
MKIATLHDGSRDGQLVVVSRDLTSAHFAAHVASTLQQVLDDWNFLSPQLEDLYATLNGGKARHAFAFEPQACLAPLPRAHLWAPGPELARSDAFLRPVAEADLPEDNQLPCRVQLAALTGDVAAGADADTALDGVRLLMLAATWGEPGAWLASAFSPVAATPDEWGPGWQAGRPTQPWALRRRGAELASAQQAEAGEGFGPRIAALARWQDLGAGSLVGGGSMEAGPGWQRGDSLRLDLYGTDGQSVVGALAVRARAPQALEAPPLPPVPAAP